MRCINCERFPGSCWPGGLVAPDGVCGCPCHPANAPDWPLTVYTPAERVVVATVLGPLAAVLVS